MMRSSRRLVSLVATCGLLAGCGASPGGGGGGGGPAPFGTDGVADLVDRVKGAVVNIDVLGPRGTPIGDTAGEAPPDDIVTGSGSGFVLRADGLIVTNEHVVAGSTRLTVTLADGRRVEGAVVGRDAVTDLALVRVEAGALPVLPLADPASLRVGQFVVALGSPLGLEQTVTWGILSALNRRLTVNARVGYLQTDAPINPGNSGGPLLNLDGRVIGVSTAVARRGQGIAFGVPVGTLRTILPQLEAHGRAAHAWLGVSVSESAGTLTIEEVVPGSPAARAGIRPGDRLRAVDGAPTTDAYAFIAKLSGLSVGTSVRLGLERDGASLTRDVTLGELPTPSPRRTGRMTVAMAEAP
jgi:serine protease Do